MIPYKQLSLNDIFQDCQNKFENDKPEFLSLLEQHINLDEIIPVTFYNLFYASTGRTRKYPLKAFLWALIIQRIFTIPKVKWEKNPDNDRYERVCHCDNPCTTSSCGRMVYIYPEKDLRAYPGTLRGTKEWDNTYKIRTAVERDINHIKENHCLAGRRTVHISLGKKLFFREYILLQLSQILGHNIYRQITMSNAYNQHLYEQLK